MSLATLASAASITVFAPSHAISGTTPIATINGLNDGDRVLLHPTGLWTLVTGGNIAAAFSAALNEPVELLMKDGLLYKVGADQASNDLRYVNTSGDEMTGNLGIGVAPVATRLHIKQLSGESGLKLTNDAASRTWSLVVDTNALGDGQLGIADLTAGVYGLKISTTGAITIINDTYRSGAEVGRVYLQSRANNPSETYGHSVSFRHCRASVPTVTLSGMTNVGATSAVGSITVYDFHFNMTTTAAGVSYALGDYTTSA